MFLELREALESLLKIRLERGKWVDSEPEVGLLKTLEALSCFSSPAFYYEKLKLLDRKFELVKIPENVLMEDIEDILEKIKKYGYPPSPYLDSEFEEIGVEYKPGETDFTDTVSFLLTTLLDLHEYFEVVYKKECPMAKSMNEEIVNAFEWLKNNAVEENGKIYWLWGVKDKIENVPSVYFTWSAVVALAYLYQNEHSPISEAQKREIRELLEKVKKWIIESLQPDTRYPDIRLTVNYPRVEDAELGRREALFIYIANIIDWLEELQIEFDTETMVKILDTFLDIYKRREMWRFEAGDHVVLVPTRDGGIKLIEYEDRAYEYLLLTVLAYFYARVHGKKIPIDKEKIELLKEFTNFAKDKMLEERDPVIKLWKKGGFLIYQTQRAIEAMVAWLRYVQPFLGIELSMEEIVKLAVDNALDELRMVLTEKIYKNIQVLMTTQKVKWEEK